MPYYSALPGETQKHKNRIFLLKYCIAALPDFNQPLAECIHSCYSQLMLMLLYDSLNLVVS